MSQEKTFDFQAFLQSEFNGIKKQFENISIDLKGINGRLTNVETGLTNVNSRLTQVETRLVSLDDRVSHLENSNGDGPTKSGKKSRSELMKMSIPDLKKEREKAIRNKETRDMNYVDEIGDIIEEKMVTFEKLGSWPEVTRYYKLLAREECEDISSYLQLGLPRAEGKAYNNYNKYDSNNYKRYDSNSRNPESKFVNKSYMKEYVRRNIDQDGNIIFTGKNYEAKLGIKEKFRNVSNNIKYTGNIYIKDENGFDVEIQSDDIQKIEKVIERLHQSNIITTTENPKFLSEIVAVRKKNTVRLTLNLIQFNKLCRKYSAKYLSEKLVGEKILESSSAGTIDIEDGFFNIDLHEDDQNFICFEWNGTFYKFLKVPQGAKNSPYIFDTAMKDTLSEEPNANNYIDDIVITNIEDESQMKPIEDTITSHGFKIGRKEFSNENISFLGRQYDLKNKTWKKDPVRLEKSKVLILKHFKNEIEIMTKRKAYSILSTLTSLFQGYIIPDQIKEKFNEIKDVQWDVKACKFSKSWIISMLDKASKPMEIPLLIDKVTPEDHIYLDASDTGLGMGIFIENSVILRACEISNLNDWTRLHINDREMLALEMAIDHLPERKKAKYNICTDNPAVLGLLSWKKVQYNSLVFSRVRQKILDSKISYTITKMDKKNEDYQMKIIDGLSRGAYPECDNLEIYTGIVNLKDASVKIKNYSDDNPSSSRNFY